MQTAKVMGHVGTASLSWQRLSVGYVVRDTFFFDGAITDTTLAFGCETAAENGILTSKKDGLVGFGHGVYTFHASWQRLARSMETRSGFAAKASIAHWVL